MSLVIRAYIGSDTGNATSEIAGVEYASIHSSLFSIYYEGRLVINDIARRYQSHIKTGLDLKLAIIDTMSGNSRLFPFKLLSFSKKLNTKTLSNMLEFKLISPWYFDEATKKVAYRGTVSQIIQSAMSEESYYRGATFIESSADVPHTRYRLNQSAQEFCQQISQYGISEDSPMILYAEPAPNSLIYRSVKSLTKLPRRYILTPDYPEYTIPNEYKDLPHLIMQEYHIWADAADLHTSNKIYTEAKAYQSTDEVTSGAEVFGPDYKYEESILATPDEVTYTDWSEDPKDAVARYRHEIFNKYRDMYSLECMTTQPIGLLASNLLGAKIRVEHPEKSNPSGDKYISDIVYAYTSGQILQTKLRLIQIS